MSRLIDADALKRRLIKRREEIASERRYGWEWEYNGFNCAILLTGCEAVENPIHPEPHWIPVTERLPEKTGKYLAWAVVSFIPDHVDEPNTIKQIAIASYSTRARTWLGDNVEDVIAWMPLPEPFKGVTE